MMIAMPCVCFCVEGREKKNNPKALASHITLLTVDFRHENLFDRWLKYSVQNLTMSMKSLILLS